MARFQPITAVTACALLAIRCGGGASIGGDPVRVDGSSTVYPLSELGYVGFGYFERHRSRLKPVSVDDLKDDVGRGPIEPTVSNISRGVYRPLSRPLFIYVNAARLSRPEIQSFTRFYLRQAGELAASTGTVPLTGTAYELSRQRLAKGVTGTMYKAPDAASLSVEYLLNQ